MAQWAPSPHLGVVLAMIPAIQVFYYILCPRFSHLVCSTPQYQHSRWGDQQGHTYRGSSCLSTSLGSDGRPQSGLWRRKWSHPPEQHTGDGVIRRMNYRVGRYYCHPLISLCASMENGTQELWADHPLKQLALPQKMTRDHYLPPLNSPKSWTLTFLGVASFGLLFQGMASYKLFFSPFRHLGNLGCGKNSSPLCVWCFLKLEHSLFV